MSAMASQITSVTIVYSTVYSGADRRKLQGSATLASVGGNSPVTGEFPAQMASNVENVFIWWRHHDKSTSIGIMAWMNNYIHIKEWDIITHPHSNIINNNIIASTMGRWLVTCVGHDWWPTKTIEWPCKFLFPKSYDIKWNENENSRIWKKSTRFKC